jgi:aldehyde dehydrogenase (NAD+)
METVLSYIEAGKSEGAKLVCGGERADIGTGKGYFVKPTIFDDVQPEMRVSREEIFGPVLATIRFKDAEDAVAKGNATVYGLAAAVWTRDVKRAHRVAHQIRAGTVWINNYRVWNWLMPFGGYKASGYGRENGIYVMEHYTQTKSVFVDLQEDAPDWFGD